MTDLTTLSPAQLDKMLKADIIAHILEGQTNSDVNLVKDEYGNNVELTEVVRNALTGNLVSSKVVKWTYYPSGEVDTIVVVDEGIGEKTRRVIKHFTDGKQPVATKRVTKIPIPEPVEVVPVVPEIPAEVIPVEILSEPMLVEMPVEEPAEKKPWYRRLWHTLWPPVSDEQEV